MDQLGRASESFSGVGRLEFDADLPEELIMGEGSVGESDESFAFVEQFVVPVAAAIWAQIRSAFTHQTQKLFDASIR